MSEVRNGFATFARSRFLLRFRVRSKRQEVVTSTFAHCIILCIIRAYAQACGAVQRLHLHILTIIYH